MAATGRRPSRKGRPGPRPAARRTRPTSRKQLPPMSSEDQTVHGTAQTLRPASVPELRVEEVLEIVRGLGHDAARDDARDAAPAEQPVTGIAMDSREVQAGDLYVGIPGARAHGAQFAAVAEGLGAVAVLTDARGLELVREAGSGLPVLVVERVREVVGPLAARIYGSQPESPEQQRLLAVTGTNGKTTTTYMITSIMRALGRTTGLIGTIEILAGQDTIPSKLTTPESTHVHSLVTVMRERGITATAMEVSSHALDYRRVDGLVYDVAGFTNLTQDHLDLHGSMQEYFEAKARLFTPEHARRGVVTVDDEWGERMARAGREALGEDAIATLATGYGRGAGAGADWTLAEVEPEGIGHRFELRHRDGRRLRTSTGLPADFNVSNAALAVAMVAESGVDHDALAEALADPATLTPLVPGRMQVVSHEPIAIVDFAHNPDALERALRAVDPARTPGDAGGKVVVVFGATGERDQTKRPIMGAVAARHADVVLVTDDDPHDEDPAPIRAAVAAGAEEAVAAGARARTVENVAPRAAAIRRAVELAGPGDSILVSGRGHEVSQEVAGVDLDLDDREELRTALREAGRAPQEKNSDAPTDDAAPQAGEHA